LTKAVEVKVIAGDINLNEPLRKSDSPTRVTMTAKQWTIHEDYNLTTRVNDIALIQLPENIPYTVNTEIVHVHKHDLMMKHIFDGIRSTKHPFTTVAFLKDNFNSTPTMQYKSNDLVGVGSCRFSPAYSQETCYQSSQCGNRLCLESFTIQTQVQSRFRHYTVLFWAIFTKSAYPTNNGGLLNILGSFQNCILKNIRYAIGSSYIFFANLSINPQ
jgi:hypothetical protein